MAELVSTCEDEASPQLQISLTSDRVCLCNYGNVQTSLGYLDALKTSDAEEIKTETRSSSVKLVIPIGVDEWAMSRRSTGLLRGTLRQKQHGGWFRWRSFWDLGRGVFSSCSKPSSPFCLSESRKPTMCLFVCLCFQKRSREASLSWRRSVSPSDRLSSAISIFLSKSQLCCPDGDVFSCISLTHMLFFPQREEMSWTCWVRFCFPDSCLSFESSDLNVCQKKSWKL